MEYLKQIFYRWLFEAGLSDYLSETFSVYILFSLVILAAIILYYITKRIMQRIVHQLAKKSKTHWDDILIEKKFFSYLSYLAPALLIYIFTPTVLEQFPKTVIFFRTALEIYMIIIVLLVINSFLNSIGEIYQDFKIAKTKSIKGYIQIVKVIAIFVAIIIIIASLLNQSPWGLLGGLGAFTAILLLIFKDTILGFVGGIQISANDMVRPGDWIDMPKYGADGTVIDITLTTVKVRNWDKTISTIPTYSLISDSVRNWRGMEESGGRRIKRSVNIDMKSIKFCTPDMLEKFKKIEYLTEYITKKEEELKAYNERRNIDNSILVNGRRQTNIGVFRAYLKGYLRNHPKVHNDMTFLIRQLQPTEKGLPVEIYVFSREQAWAIYEDVQADIFDHVLSVVQEFDLQVFQNPTGADFRKLAG